MKTYKLFGPDGEYISETPGTLGGNGKGKVYGRLDCSAALNSMKQYPGVYEKTRVFFADEKMALAAGFRPCGRCLHDKYVEYFARLREGVSFERVSVLAATFDLTFFCPDPYGYALEDEVFSITTLGSHTVLRVKGNTESVPVYRVKGALSSGSTVTVTTNGTELQIANAALHSGEVMVIDGGKMSAWIEDADGNTVRNALPYISELNFPVLKTGNNTVSVAASNATFTELEILAKSRWR